MQRWRLRAAGWVAGQRIRAHYNGASTGRLFWDWAVSILSPDAELRGNNTLLRARARDLAKNNAFIAGFAIALEDNLIGPDGILLQAKVLTASGDLVKKTNWEIERAWKEWGYPENASIDTRASWHDVQRQIARNLAIDGEVFIRRRRDADNAFQFAVQLIDPDQVDETYNEPLRDGREIRMGVELNADGRPLAYHVLTRHPSETPRGERVRIDAAEIKHLFVQLRPGQTRGVTWLAPILTSIKHLDGYEEAELVAARMQASQAGAIEITDPDAIAAYTASLNRDGSTAAAQPVEMAPGMLPRLAPGERLANYSPTHPNMNFPEFVKAIAMPMARALGISYLTLTGDVSAANYSSMRAGLIPERDRFRLLQNFIAMHGCRWVYRQWVGQALLTQQLRVDTRVRADLYAVEWKGRGWKWVDPANELDAAEKELALGLTSRQRLCGERGVDYEDVVDELKYEGDYAREQGVDVSVERKGAEPAGGLTERRTEREERDTRALALVKAQEA